MSSSSDARVQPPTCSSRRGGPEAALAIVDRRRDELDRTPPLRTRSDRRPADVVALRTLGTGPDRWLAAIAPLPDGGTYVVLASPVSIVVAAARDLVRAFLVAILAAALLAVVAALWLSTRITRPMLDLADEAERVKVDFLASVSHELRTPLTPIRGYTDLLRRGRCPAGDASGYLDEIGQAAQRLERIVALLLDVASIEAGRFRVDSYESSRPSCCATPRPGGRDVRGATGSRSRCRKTSRTCMADPRSARSRAGRAHRQRDQVLAGRGGRAPRATRSGRSRRVRVRDEGPGIDAERVEALREAFTQADTGDTRRFGGLGLGLAFAEGVLRAHGSRLDITTAPGEGTTCSFTLPAAGSVSRMSTARTERSAAVAGARSASAAQEQARAPRKR